MKSLTTIAAAAGMIAQIGIAQADEVKFEALVSQGDYRGAITSIGVASETACKNLGEVHSAAMGNQAAIQITCLENGMPITSYSCIKGECQQRFPKPD